MLTIRKFLLDPKLQVKFGLFEKGTKFEKIFHLIFDVTQFKFCALLKKTELYENNGSNK